MKKMTVLITGITSGIGKETALRFCRGGWNVIGHYCSNDKAAASLKRELAGKYKCDISLHKADFSSHKDILGFLKAIKPHKI
ncbi:MAG: SDR family oxidoreductase, partial [Candidatus Omnitrophica bacterium]|nr:SDR family oxidoreductase [Candidatus Omnitrophota bacterium]